MIKIQTKYYNASNNFSAPIKREPRPYSPNTMRSEIIIPQKTENLHESEPDSTKTALKSEEKTGSSRELSLKTDDLLLIGLIILLLPDIENNLLLVLVLGYLLIAGMG